MATRANYLWSKISPAAKGALIFFCALAILSLLGIGFVDPKYILLIDAVFVALAVFYFYPTIGLYLMILLYPFSGWQFKFNTVNLPYSDLIALLLFCSVALNVFIKVASGQEKFKIIFKENFPGVLFAGLFFLIGFLSLANVDWRIDSIKYLLRPMIFFYLMFVVLPQYIIKDKVVFKRALYCFLIVGTIVSLLGLLSAVFPQGENVNLHRAAPYAIFGFNPIAGNQNAIAEILVGVLPMAMLLFVMSGKIKERGWYVLAGIFFCLIILLTFSRAGWLALIIELLVLYFIQRRHLANRYVFFAIIFCVILSVLIVYFAVWQNIDWIKTSNANRLLLTNISWNAFWEHPFIGHGPNTFQDVVGRTFVYTVEFGDPLESHGFIQKLMVETGLLGLLSFLSLLAVLARKLWLGFIAAKGREARAVGACLIVLFSGVVAFEIFSTSYFLAVMWLTIGLALSGVKFYEQ